jgi:hypothetical protein
MSYIDIVICIGPLPILETWPPIYRGQERMERDRLRVSQSSPHVYFRYTPCLTDFTFEFIQCPTPPILSPSYWTFVELTLATAYLTIVAHLIMVLIQLWENPGFLKAPKQIIPFNAIVGFHHIHHQSKIGKLGVLLCDSVKAIVSNQCVYCNQANRHKSTLIFRHNQWQNKLQPIHQNPWRQSCKTHCRDW